MEMKRVMKSMTEGTPGEMRTQVLRGKIALVAGATRGAGRGIAVALGEAGATVYCTGRSSRKENFGATRLRAVLKPLKKPRSW